MPRPQMFPTAEEFAQIDALRAKGFVICYWTPDDVRASFESYEREPWPDEMCVQWLKDNRAELEDTFYDQSWAAFHHHVGWQAATDEPAKLAFLVEAADAYANDPEDEE